MKKKEACISFISTRSPNFIEFEQIFEQRHCPFLYRLKRRQHRKNMMSRKNAFPTGAMDMHSRNIFELCGQISSCIRQGKQYL
jgi:hypothetical protein